jgi:hypothetical protein
MGYVSILLGIVVFGLIMWVLFAPPPYVALPTIIIGVASIVSALLVAVTIATGK